MELYEVHLPVKGIPFIIDIEAESEKEAVNKAIEIYYDASVEEIESGKEE